MHFLANCTLYITFFFLPFLWKGTGVGAQNIGINSTGANPDASAMLDIDATNKGLLIPRVSLTSTTDVVTIPTPATSLLVYNTNAAMTGGSVGYWYWNGANWVTFSGGGGNAWLLLGNAGTVDGTNFLGTTDNVPLNFRVFNNKAGRIASTGEVFFGYLAGNSNTAISCTGIGYQALYSNTTGVNNNGFGYQALYSNTNAFGNTAIGHLTLTLNTANFNTATGTQSLRYNTTGQQNTANGGFALLYNTTGNDNTANGLSALYSNITGSGNTATGYGALYDNTIGVNNTANGVAALSNNTTGGYNTASGRDALIANTTGGYNTGSGYQALLFNSAGTSNTALGYNAGYGAAGVNFTQCTFVGSTSYPTVARTNVTMLGYGIANAQCTGDNQVLLGNTAIVSPGLRSQQTGITAYSDARFKTNIKENVAGLDFILRLKPVTYNVRPKELHKIWGTPDSLVNKIDHSEAEKETRIGFIAQDVEKAAKESGFNFPGIDAPQNAQEVYTMRYVDFIMPVVKAVQELNTKNDSLQFTVYALQLENQKLQTELSNLTTKYSLLNTKMEKLEELLMVPR